MDQPPVDPTPPDKAAPRKPPLPLVAAGILLAGVPVVYLAATRLDRAIATVEANQSKLVDDDLRDYLLEHAEDPRVHAIFRGWFDKEAEHCEGGLNDFYQGKLRTMQAAFTTRRPEVDDAWVRVVARLSIAGYDEAQPLVPGYAEDPRVPAAALEVVAFFAKRPHLLVDQYTGRGYTGSLLRAVNLLRERQAAEEEYLADFAKLALGCNRPEALEALAAWPEDHPLVVQAYGPALVAASTGYWKKPDDHAVLRERIAALPAERLPDTLLDAYLANYASCLAIEQGRVYTVTAESSSELSVAALREAGEAFARRLRERVEALQEPDAKSAGLLLCARLGAGRPGDAAVLLEWARLVVTQEDPRTRKPGVLRHSEAYVDGLARLGVDAVAPLLRAWRGGQAPVGAWAQALARIHAGRFARETVRALIDYEPLAWSFIIRRQGAKADRERFDQLQIASLRALEALASVADPAADVAFVAALACPDSGIEEYAATTLRKRLDGDRFADALFGYLATRPSFQVREVELYERVLTSYAGVGPAIVRNLERLLERAGSPDRVSWIHKVIGLQSLAKVGGPDSAALLKRYAQDATSYEYVETVTRGTKTTESRRTVKFADLAQQALQAIEAR